MRAFTAGSVDSGAKPAVVTAIAKYHATEMFRQNINDGMDIIGGRGIIRGPRNLLANAYFSTPISITVEGANIMTRTLIVFGQGALRSHPYAYAEVRALEANDLRGFDVAFWGHIGHIVRNFCRSVLLSVTRGYLAGSPDVHPKTTRYYQRLQWTSATFAILADVAMGVLGGQLKMKEKLTGRFADIMAQMYIATCVLRRFEAEGRKEEDLAFVHYCVKNCLVEIQKAFDGIFDNLTIPGINWFFKGWMGAWSRINSIGSQASDNWSHVISDSMLNNQQQRLRLTEGIYVPTDRNQQVARLDYAYQMVHKAESIEQKMRAAVKSKTLPRLKGMKLAEEALAKSVITSEEFKLLQETESVRYDAIMVDDFSEDQYHGRVYP
jgi:acyl-CoA dehydrogenase